MSSNLTSYRFATSSHRTLIAVAIALTAGRVLAVPLNVIGGATYNASSGTGFVSATIDAAPGTCVNNLGTAIGEATLRTPTKPDGGARALLWTPSGFSTLPTGPDPTSGVRNSTAEAINESGAIAYDYETFTPGGTSKGRRAGRLDTSGAIELASPFLSANGYAEVRAYAINESGIPAGSSSRYNGNTFQGYRPLRWAPNATTAYTLPTLQANTTNGYVVSEVLAINDSTVMAGYSELYAGSSLRGTRAVRWTAGGTIEQLGTLGTDSAGVTTARAVAIDALGAIAANVTKYDLNFKSQGMRAVRYGSSFTTPVELDTLGSGIGGVTKSTVSSISADGLIVGTCDDYFGSQSIGNRAVYWPVNSTAIVALPTFGTHDGVTDSVANSVNADGAIVGSADKYANNVYQRRIATLWLTAGTDVGIDLNTLISPTGGWSLQEATGISDTGFISGVGIDNPTGTFSYQRHFSILVPQAGTYGRGDADFDTSINFDDLLIVAQHYGLANASKDIHFGDFDLDGAVDFDDLLMLAQHYGSGPALLSAGNPAFAADWALAQSLVPEPAMLTLSSILLILSRRTSSSRRAI